MFILPAIFILLTAILASLKWQFGLYDLMDLAIFSQSVQNLSLYNTIQGTSYFADHFSPLIYLLSLIYQLIPHPGTLIGIQILSLASTCIPLKRLFPKLQNLLIFAFLFNPITINIALYEFELLPFIIPLFFWTYFFYSKHQFSWFLSFLVLGLMVREDTFLLLLGFPLLAWMEKRSKSWILIPFLTILAYTLLAFSVIAHVNPDGSYKFLLLYPSFSPLMLFRLEVFGMCLGLLMPFFFLPLLKPKYLLFCLLPFLQLAFTAGGGGNMAVQSHYGSMLLCGLILSLAYVWEQKSHFLLKFLLCISLIYTSLGLTPILSLFSSPHPDASILSIAQRIPPGSYVLSAATFLPYLNSSHVYAQNYAYLGVQQYSHNPYQTNSLDYILIDTEELLGMRYQYKQHPIYSDYLEQGVDRLQTLIAQNHLTLIWFQDQFLVFGREVLPNTQKPQSILWSDLHKDLLIQTKNKNILLPPEYALLQGMSPIQVRLSEILSTREVESTGSVVLSPTLSSSVIPSL